MSQNGSIGLMLLVVAILNLGNALYFVRNGHDAGLYMAAIAFVMAALCLMRGLVRMNRWFEEDQKGEDNG